MGADEADLAPDLVGPGVEQRRGQPDRTPRGLIAHRDLAGPAGQVGVGLAHVGCDSLHQLGSGPPDPVTDIGQLRVPDVEGERCLVAEPAPDLLEERRLVAQDALQLTPIGVAARMEADGHFVEKAAPERRTVLDQGQVVRGEHGRSYDTEQIGGPLQPLLVDQHAIPAPGRQFALDAHHPSVALLDLGPDEGTLAAVPHQRRPGNAAEALPGGQVGDGLDQVRLALPVGADHRGEARAELDAGLLVVAEVSELQPLDPHRSSRSAGVTTRSWPISSRLLPSRRP